MTDDQQRARAQFEAWAKSTNKGIHGFNRVEDMWDAWQAAAAALRAAPDAVALRTAMTTLEQIANAPDDQGAKFNAAGTVAFLKTQGAGGPEGFVMVPVEPTEAMIIAGVSSFPSRPFTPLEEWEIYQEMSGCEQAAYRAKKCWAAMLAARPQEASDA